MRTHTVLSSSSRMYLTGVESSRFSFDVIFMFNVVFLSSHGLFSFLFFAELGSFNTLNHNGFWFSVSVFDA